MTMQIENISDDDLMNMEVPPTFTPAPVQQEEQQQEQEPEPVIEPEPTPAENAEPEGDDNADGGEADGKEVKQPEGDADLSDADLDKQQAPTPAPEKKVEEKKEGEPTPAEQAKEEKKETPQAAEKAEEKVPEVDFATEYAKLVGTPIKANGREITLKNTDEVLRLVQQGANYAKRMEELKPARKSASMLEKAGILGNEVALAHAIDLYNGDPAAIVKMVKDLKIDIFALDMEADPKYSPDRHLQSDEAVNFEDTLKEVRTLDGGIEAMKLIDSWDQKSKDMVWGNATAVRQIYDYKQSGVYDTVATEIERRRTLGQLPVDQPFIVSFQQVGEEMAKAAEASTPTPAPVPPVNTPEPVPAKPAPRTPVASGVAPRKVETPDARAAAAASPRGGVGQAKQPIDIYQYSDADIEKMSGPPV